MPESPREFRSGRHQLRGLVAWLVLTNLVSGVSVLAQAVEQHEVLAQAAPETPNLVPNPSFEEFRVRPLGWYFKGANYNRVMRYWRSPTAASPDAYNPDVRVPGNWADKGFGDATPHSGDAMSGLTVYGCADGKPHCREYLQVQLTEPLVRGQRYSFSVWVAALPRGLRCNGLSAAFLDVANYYDDDRRLSAKPLVTFTEIAEPGQGWTELVTQFTATGEELYLLFGNFAEDASTKTVTPAVDNPLNFAYYYIDDIAIRKIEPFARVATDPDDLSQKVLRAGESITLRDVYFDTDSDELQPRSFRELDKLVALMRRYGEVRVRIVGHTDNEGTPDYNEDLSRRRAATVVRYCEEHGIARRRLDSEGRGQRQPVADNATADGRQLNRRVVAEVE